VREHARAAASAGHRVIVLADEGPDPRVRGLYATAEERDGPLPVIRFTYRPRAERLAYLLAVLRLARRLRRAGTPIDILHAHVHRMGWPAVMAGALLRCPVVISEHSSEWSDGTLSSGALRRARIAFRRAALVCPVSRSLQASIESRGVRARFRVVPNAVDTDVFHPAEGTAGPAGERLVNVALHEEIKSLDVLLAAFAVVAGNRPEASLELIGEGPQTASLQELAATLGIAERVRFRGALPPHEVAAALREPDLFVLSSRSETFGAAVIEALCAGLPVVATAVGGIPEIVGEGDGVLAPPADPGELASAVVGALDDYGRFDRAEISRRAQARYSTQAIGATWDEIYRALD
jgi:glycosyltransferase involved in cell wall biosynthesis